MKAIITRSGCWVEVLTDVIEINETELEVHFTRDGNGPNLVVYCKDEIAKIEVQV